MKRFWLENDMFTKSEVKLLRYIFLPHSANARVFYYKGTKFIVAHWPYTGVSVYCKAGRFLSIQHTDSGKVLLEYTNLEVFPKLATMITRFLNHIYVPVLDPELTVDLVKETLGRMRQCD